MSTEQNKAVVRHVFDELNKENLAVLDEVCAPNYVVHFPGTPGPMTREAIKPIWGMFFAAFPGLQHSIEDMVAEGDKVAARCSVRARHEGDFLGRSATQSPVDFTGMTIVRIYNGKIVEAWNNFDFMTLHKQVGLI